jgi:outer membrane biosynthesis protein TonB
VLFGALVVWVCFYSYSSIAEEFIEPGSEGTTQYQIFDDSNALVDLPVPFTMNGQVFTNSAFMSNGAVVMYGPNINTNAPFQHFCCNGQDVASMAANGTLPGQPFFNYTIAALWTDLIDLNVDVTGDGIPDSGFFTKEIDTDNDGDIDTLRYYWRYIAEFHDANNLNTFGVEMNFDSGAIEIHHFDINIVNHAVTVGIFGDTANNEIEQFRFEPSGYNSKGEVIYTFNLDAMCAANPLYSSLCTGYAEALAEIVFAQNCAVDALYDPSCPGYEQLYYETFVLPEQQALEESNTVTEEPTTVTGLIEDFSVVSTTGDAIIDNIIDTELDLFVGFDATNTIETIPETLPEVEFTVEEQTTQEIEIAEVLEEPIETVEEMSEPEEQTEEIASDDEQSEEEPREEIADNREETTETAEVEPEVEETTEEVVEEKKEDKKESKKKKIKSIIAKKAADNALKIANAVSLEEQQAAQGLAIALMNFNQGFGAYQATMPDGVRIDSVLPKSYTEAPKENQRGLRNGLAQQILHDKMVDMQYQ